MQILGLRQGFIPVLRQLAINHGALELRGKLRLLLLVLLEFKPGYAKTIKNTYLSASSHSRWF